MIRMFAFFMLLSGLVTGCSPSSGKATLIVSAPASMSDAVSEITRKFEASHPQVDVKVNFGASGSLKQQIEKGAPVDVYLSASKKEMDALTGKNLILKQTVHSFAGNSLVLIEPKTGSDHLQSLNDLTASRVKWVAIGEPKFVPAGRYADQALHSFHLWDDLKHKFVFGKDVRQVLTYVEQGQVNAGIVYKTDALTSKKVRIVQTLPENSHQPIQYFVGTVKQTKQAGIAAEYEKFLLSKQSIPILHKYGFVTKQQ
ncbi:molybdate ABC transporter substrate-binding protein [Thermoactinomyces sp. CICC 10521]|uniref:molybdate ABC transporter substrate-binding protein n=1 Tax=Thermoactinomyces sp. CICC 10521 TaxID=2767426 RepID=UPI0018DB3574|nr:molybdate ABC transporter substrate-binding protein [Thermoactinomyces sp. CICC 10521]MBH8607452.1 molybdate ABC transporter substrate-binding protein [Thermoactinomyces sp. CICC 10521]